MTTQILKPAEKKALKLGIGLSTGYLALSILITVYFGSEYKDRINPTKNHNTEKTSKCTSSQRRCASSTTSEFQRTN